MRGIEAVASNAPKVKDYLVSAAPLRIAGDRISGAVIAMVDLSQRKAAEKQQNLLMRELDHRVKNILAMVVSISARTASNTDTVHAFQKAFSNRIQALAATHTLLLENSWSSLMLRDIVMAELAPYIETAADQVIVEGLNVAITPRAAIAFGLIVHELATNAVKYGALSQQGGRVAVRAVGHNNEANGAFVLEWRESGGPLVTPPERQGFGHTVITRSLQYSGGGAEFDFDPSGLVCHVSIPPEELCEQAPNDGAPDIQTLDFSMGRACAGGVYPEGRTCRRSPAGEALSLTPKDCISPGPIAQVHLLEAREWAISLAP